jgi:hypothetical protein
MLFMAFQEVVAAILDEPWKKRAKFCEIIEKLLQLCFSDRKFVILVQAISELVLTLVKQQ